MQGPRLRQRWGGGLLRIDISQTVCYKPNEPGGREQLEREGGGHDARTGPVETRQISAEINIDISPDGKIYGIELLNAKEQFESTGKTFEVPLKP